MEYPATKSGAPFPATCWSWVTAAAGGDEEASRIALNELCGRYWRPVYSYIRHLGRSPHDAEDLTQAYFSDLLARGYLGRADSIKGRFRSYLVRDLKFFLGNEAAKGLAEKRGGRVSVVPLDADRAERLYATDGAGTADPDACFDRQWALDTVRLAREEIAAAYRRQGKEQLFSVLQPGLARASDAELCEEWGGTLGMSPGAVKIALHRLRRRFRKALEGQVAQTVASEEDLHEEMRHLFRALARVDGA